MQRFLLFGFHLQATMIVHRSSTIIYLLIVFGIFNVVFCLCPEDTIAFDRECYSIVRVGCPQNYLLIHHECCSEVCVHNCVGENCWNCCMPREVAPVSHQQSYTNPTAIIPSPSTSIGSTAQTSQCQNCATGCCNNGVCTQTQLCSNCANTCGNCQTNCNQAGQTCCNQNCQTCTNQPCGNCQTNCNKAGQSCCNQNCQTCTNQPCGNGQTNCNQAGQTCCNQNCQTCSNQPCGNGQTNCNQVGHTCCNQNCQTCTNQPCGNGQTNCNQAGPTCCSQNCQTCCNQPYPSPPTIPPPIPPYIPPNYPVPTRPPPTSAPTLPPTTQPPVPLTRCPSGTILVGVVCQPLYCPWGTRMEDNKCIQIVCPDGTHWDGDKCAVITPIVHNITTHHHFVTHLNSSSHPIIIPNNNNIPINISLNLAGQQCCDNEVVTAAPKPSDRCCTIKTPRACAPSDKQWKCSSRQYKACGDFCTKPTIYLTPPKIYEKQNVIVMPPTYIYGQREDGYDCSGCSQSIGQRCSRYCSRYICPSLSCSYLSQQQFCLSYPQSLGCLEQNGCYDQSWCTSGVNMGF
uniref:Uncharacterized protein n=1 Tax=Stomoxys calcitrans TaxID=35570 RepID=A0A1I8P4L4_STOCA